MSKIIDFDKPFSRNNLIVCSFSNYTKLKTKYPSKNFAPDENCSDNWFYYLNRKGDLRHYSTKDGYLYYINYEIPYGSSIPSSISYFKTKYKVKCE